MWIDGVQVELNIDFDMWVSRNTKVLPSAEAYLLAKKAWERTQPLFDFVEKLSLLEEKDMSGNYLATSARNLISEIKYPSKESASIQRLRSALKSPHSAT